MDFFSDNIYFVWFLIGVAFLVGELALPGFVLFFFSIGSFLVSLILYFVELSFNNQIILFISSSLISLFVLRSYMQRVFLGQQRVDEDEYFRNDQFQNDATKSFGTTVDKISSGEFGRIKYRGTFYKAKSTSNEVMINGENVRVIGTLEGDKSVYIIEKV